VVLTELANHVRSHMGLVEPSDFSAWMNEVKEATGIKGNELYHPVRIALTGTHSGPDFEKLIPVIEQGTLLNLGVPSVRHRLDAFTGV
jgi:glutamyl/glutaminyl-tRNA synthetase